MRFLILTVALWAIFSPISFLALNTSTPAWFIDLDKYGDSAGQPDAAPALHSEYALAATDKYVAVALAVRGSATRPPQVDSQSKMSLLILDANSGKLSAKCGPWTINTDLDVLATADGGFLLHMTPLADTNPQKSETLLLLSSTCAQLKQIQLPYRDGPENSSWLPLQSPTRHTLLLIRNQKEGIDYQLRASDSLDMISQWHEPISKAPIVVGVSDKGFLGVVQRPTTEASEASEYYYRTFDGAWRRLPISSYYSFLSDDILVGAMNSSPQPWKVNKAQVKAIRLDGTTVFSAAVSSNGYHVEPMSDISVSSDGDHFALSLDFAGAGWLWGNLDMGPEHHSVYVWSLSRAKPCAKIRLRRWLGHPLLAFAPRGSWFASLDGSKLTVQPVPNHIQ